MPSSQFLTHFIRCPALARAAVLFAFVALPCAAQSLHGSNASINRMYRRARAERLPFYETSRGVRQAVDRGRLERLTPNENFELHQVGYPYVKSTTKTFVQRLSAQYRNACGEQLVVTSAVRPATRQPANSVDKSVHPTGIAVDLRKPREPRCLRWLRSTLLDLEGIGVLEATEEHAPAHFHVAVFPTAYRRYVAGQTRASTANRVASNESFKW